MTYDWEAARTATRAGGLGHMTVHREPASHEQIKEYAFDVKLFAVIRVQAASEEDARRILSECCDAMCNGGAWPDGNPILFEASIDGESDLIEIDGDDAP